MNNVYVVMPVRGRKQQSVDTMIRLQKTAGYSARYLVVSGIEDADISLEVADKSGAKPLVSSSPKLTYWQALNESTKALPDEALVVNVANDLLPCVNWLALAVETYQALGDCVVGFNGDGYTQHACHFMLSMRYIRSLGGWPVWYHHNFGDTEIVYRAKQAQKFVKSHFAILFHNHPLVSSQTSDSVYDEGNSTFAADERMYRKRMEAGWTF